MSAITDAKRNLRKRSEHHLRLAVLRELGRGQPSTVEPYRSGGDLFWRMVFVPFYRRLPWQAKERAMNALGMTAKGWQPPARQPGEPWRPPAQITAAPARSTDAAVNAKEAPPPTA